MNSKCLGAYTELSSLKCTNGIEIDDRGPLFCTLRTKSLYRCTYTLKATVPGTDPSYQENTILDVRYYKLQPVPTSCFLYETYRNAHCCMIVFVSVQSVTVPCQLGETFIGNGKLDPIRVIQSRCLHTRTSNWVKSKHTHTKPVLQNRDILLRIRIRGSVPYPYL
jgi:hypothetical protein